MTMTAWTTRRIDQLGRVVTGKTPSSKRPQEFGDAFPFITPSDIPATRKHVQVERHLSERGMAAHRRIQLPKKSTCVVCIGATVGKVCMTERLSISNQQINSIIPIKGEFDPDFVYYISTTLRDSLVAFAGGAATPIINKSAFSSIKVLVPEFGVQRKISAILSAYDELIENNTRRIALLEKLAEKIYREWFVRLRFPGHKKVKLVNRQLRSFISEYVGGDWGEDIQSPKFGNRVYVIRGTDFESVQQGDISSVPVRFIKDSGLKNRKLDPGDLIVENSVNHQSRTSGKSMLVTQHVLDLFDGDVICASFCKLIRPRETKHSKFLALNLRLLFEQGLFEYFQNIATNGIANLQVERLMDRHLIPFHDDIELIIFESLDTSLLARAKAKLKETRDQLLPRLISGKLSVENLDIQFPPGMAEELNAEASATAYA
jgi:type I restriction enzyme, S subunit